MRAWSLIGAILLASASAAQSAIELQKKAIESWPPISYDELQQCAKPGEAPSTATTKFGTTSSGTPGTTFSGQSTMSFSWPSAGIYREAHVAIDGM